jgi:hypothetical protein
MRKSPAGTSFTCYLEPLERYRLFGGQKRFRRKFVKYRGEGISFNAKAAVVTWPETCRSLRKPNHNKYDSHTLHPGTIDYAIGGAQSTKLKTTGSWCNILEFGV